MLAKEVKIKTLKKQREFIKKRLTDADNTGGEVGCVYEGYVYPEVIDYFRNEGYEVVKVEQDKETVLTIFQVPFYYFHISDDIKLTEEEMKQAEEYEPNNQCDDKIW